MRLFCHSRGVRTSKHQQRRRPRCQVFRDGEGAGALGSNDKSAAFLEPLHPAVEIAGDVIEANPTKPCGRFFLHGPARR